MPPPLPRTLAIELTSYDGFRTVARGGAADALPKGAAPTAVTLIGFGFSIAWLLGGPWWMAIAGLLADELDGALARAGGDTTRFGAEADYAIDMVMLGASAMKLGLPGVLLLGPVTVASVYMRASSKGAPAPDGSPAVEVKPSWGSARALMTIAAVVAGRGAPLGR